MPRRFVAPLLLLIAALCWSLGGVLIKSIDGPPMAIAAGRSAIAIPVMLACIGWPRFSFSRAQIGGAIGYAATVVIFVFATRMTTAANAIFLQYTAPIYVAIIGRWYLDERASRIDWLVIAVASSGSPFFSAIGSRLPVFGETLSRSAAVSPLRRSRFFCAKKRRALQSRALFSATPSLRWRALLSFSRRAWATAVGGA